MEVGPAWSQPSALISTALPVSHSAAGAMTVFRVSDVSRHAVHARSRQRTSARSKIRGPTESGSKDQVEVLSMNRRTRGAKESTSATMSRATAILLLANVFISCSGEIVVQLLRPSLELYS